MRDLLLLAALIATGCRTSERCADVARRADHGATIAKCTAAYERDHAIGDGVAAALAHARAGHDDEVLAWATRLGKAPPAAPVWRAAAEIHAKRANRAAMIAARDNALSGWTALGKPASAAYEAHEIMQAHWRASELSPALVAARRGRALALASGNRDMQLATFGDLFAVLNGIGDTAAATALLDEVRAQLAPDDRAQAFYVHFYEGQLQFRTGRLAAARAAYHRVLALAAAVDDPASLRSAHYNLVEIELGLGEIAAARRELARALALVPSDAPSHARSAAAYFTALVELAEQTPERAAATLAPALTASPIDDWAWQLELAMGQAREALGQLDGAEQAYERSIAIVERMRREVALEPLQLALRDRKRAPYEAAFELAARTQRIADALALADRMWTRRFAEAFATEVERTDPDARIAGLAAITPAVARVEPSPPSRDDRDILAFVETRHAWWRYHRVDGTAVLDKIALPPADVAALVADLRANPGDREVAARLGGALIPARVVAADKPLHVIADGVLGGAPLAAVIAGKRRLVELRVLAVVPSLGTHAAAVAGTTTAPIVLGAPAGAPLAAARAEAEQVAATLGVEPRLGEAATIAGLRLAATAPVLHVAAHGGIDARSAYLELADGRVDAADVIAWRLAPRVVVLASCASGARPGRTLWGAMGAAFLAAGSRAVVASLWSVADQPTQRLIAAFYAAGGATTPHRALAAAQRRAIAEGWPVADWASFVVLGAP